MNTNTGRIYEGAEIQKAIDRNEPIVRVSRRVATLMKEAQRVRREQKRKATNRRRAELAHQSRKRNR